MVNMVNYQGTWFLTGVVSWGQSCAAAGKYAVDTRLANFLSWIHSTMTEVDASRTETPTGQRRQQDREANGMETPTGQRCQQDRDANGTETPTGQRRQRDRDVNMKM